MFYKLILLFAFITISVSFKNLNLISRNIKPSGVMMQSSDMFKDNFDPIYLVVWSNHEECKTLLEDMNNNGLDTIFCDRNEYPLDELKFLYDLYIQKHNVDINDDKQPWVFANDNYIGGVDEIYKIINYLQ